MKPEADNVKLQVLVACYSRRLGDMCPEQLPAVPGVEYIISCQNPDNFDLKAAEARMRRPDVKIFFNPGRGLSNNRNAALALASAPYILIGDDDLYYHADGLADIIKAFDADPELDLITARATTPDERTFPNDGHDLRTRVRFYQPIAIELAFRRSAWKESGVRFSPLLGVNSPYCGAGEDDVFFHRLKQKVRGARFVDTVLCDHPGTTTGPREAATPRVLRSKGVCLRVIYGNFESLARYLVEARRSPAPFFKALFYYLEGYFYSIRHRHEI